MKIRICRTCGSENAPTDLECRACMGDISGIRPVEKAEAPEQLVRTSANAVGEAPTLAMTAAGRQAPLSAGDGDILGRGRVWRDFFSAYATVSREHAKIALADGRWTIEDMGSTNGTYVNGEKLEPGRKYPLKSNDIVSLSKSCELMVLG